MCHVGALVSYSSALPGPEREGHDLLEFVPQEGVMCFGVDCGESDGSVVGSFSRSGVFSFVDWRDVCQPKGIRFLGDELCCGNVGVEESC